VVVNQSGVAALTLAQSTLTPEVVAVDATEEFTFEGFLISSGTETLVIDSLQYAGDEGISVVDPATFPLTLEAGASADMTIRIAPTERDSFTGTVTFFSNAESVQTVTIEAIGGYTVLSVLEATITFDTTDIDESNEKEVVVINDGNMEGTLTGLSIVNETNGEVFALPDFLTPPVVPANDSVRIPLTFAPTMEGDFAADLIMVSDEQEVATVKLVGVGRKPTSVEEFGISKSRVSVLPNPSPTGEIEVRVEDTQIGLYQVLIADMRGAIIHTATIDNNQEGTLSWKWDGTSNGFEAANALYNLMLVAPNGERLSMPIMIAR
jgi:hypothetical protein